MSAISVRFTDSIHNMARKIACEDHISLNQFIVSAVNEKISALTTETYLAQRAVRGSVDKFRAALACVVSGYGHVRTYLY